MSDEGATTHDGDVTALTPESPAARPAPATSPAVGGEDMHAAIVAADIPRRWTGLGLIVIGALAVFACGWVAHLHVFQADLTRPDVLNAAAAPFLIGARAVFGASLVGAALSLVHVGKNMMMPATVIREMAAKHPSKSSLADEVMAGVKRIRGE